MGIATERKAIQQDLLALAEAEQRAASKGEAGGSAAAQQAAEVANEAAREWVASADEWLEAAKSAVAAYGGPAKKAKYGTQTELARAALKQARAAATASAALEQATASAAAAAPAAPTTFMNPAFDPPSADYDTPAAGAEAAPIAAPVASAASTVATPDEVAFWRCAAIPSYLSPPPTGRQPEPQAGGVHAKVRALLALDNSPREAAAASGGTVAFLGALAAGERAVYMVASDAGAITFKGPGAARMSEGQTFAGKYAAIVKALETPIPAPSSALASNPVCFPREGRATALDQAVKVYCAGLIEGFATELRPSDTGNPTPAEVRRAASAIALTATCWGGLTAAAELGEVLCIAADACLYGASDDSKERAEDYYADVLKPVLRDPAQHATLVDRAGEWLAASNHGPHENLYAALSDAIASVLAATPSGMADSLDADLAHQGSSWTGGQPVVANSNALGQRAATVLASAADGVLSAPPPPGLAGTARAAAGAAAVAATFAVRGAATAVRDAAKAAVGHLSQLSLDDLGEQLKPTSWIQVGPGDKMTEMGMGPGASYQETLVGVTVRHPDNPDWQSDGLKTCEELVSGAKTYRELEVRCATLGTVGPLRMPASRGCPQSCLTPLPPKVTVAGYKRWLNAANDQDDGAFTDVVLDVDDYEDGVLEYPKTTSAAAQFAMQTPVAPSDEDVFGTPPGAMQTPGASPATVHDDSDSDSDSDSDDDVVYPVSGGLVHDSRLVTSSPGADMTHRGQRINPTLSGSGSG